MRARHSSVNFSDVSVPALKAALHSKMVAVSRSTARRAETGASAVSTRATLTVNPRRRVVMRGAIIVRPIAVRAAPDVFLRRASAHTLDVAVARNHANHTPTLFDEP